MSKKDYEKFAEALRDARMAKYDTADAAIAAIERDLINIFRRDNSRFDAQRFLAASEW